MQRALSFDASPRLHVPLRFLVSAPAFALLAGLLLAWAGPQAMASRWNGSVLALTHLFTLGVLANAMAGALLQILPVATGIRVLAANLTARGVHALVNLGTLALALAFMRVSPVLFTTAAAVLTTGLLWLAFATFGGLWRDRQRRTKGAPTILMAVRLAAVALVITVALGLTLAGSMGLGLPLPRALTDLHAAWGLAGWIGLLVAGISYQVIPMFQVTERYPAPVTRWLALVIFILLGALTANSQIVWNAQRESAWVLASVLAAAYAFYAAVTYDLLRRRKRPAPDTTTLFWYMAMACLAACLPVWLLHVTGIRDFSVLLGTLFVAGFAWSAVNGMLYKILPFLLWYNTQRNLDVALPVVPKVRHFIPDDRARPQFYGHAAAMGFLITAAAGVPGFTRPAGILLTLSAAWLLANIVSALRVYRQAGRDIAAALRARQ